MIRNGLRFPTKYGVRLPQRTTVKTFHASASQSSQNKSPDAEHDQKSSKQTSAEEAKIAKKKKTLAEMDEEIRMAMEGHAGDGGISGAELEGGKAVAMKRGVKSNMFRYI